MLLSESFDVCGKNASFCLAHDAVTEPISLVRIGSTVEAFAAAVCAELLGSNDTRAVEVPVVGELMPSCGLSTIVDLIELSKREYAYETFI